jgi:acetate kinase
MSDLNKKSDPLILSLNAGSSSLRLSLIKSGLGNEEILISGIVENIGKKRASLRLYRGTDVLLLDEELILSNHVEAAQKAIELTNEIKGASFDAIGHRIVHGGEKYSAPARIDDELIRGLRSAVPLAPLHLPAQIALIEWAAMRYPGVPQVACFDTWFHRFMPQVARQFPLPHDFYEQGLHRYGFHGLSYESVLFQLGRRGRGRLIIAHLGNGVSLSAVKDGQSLDTTMGFSPAGGVMMGTRSGDLDPGLLLYLLQKKGYKTVELERIINHESGLLGVSGTNSDMGELLTQRATDFRARFAIEMFCYQVRKNIAALATVFGGLDALIFTGGIGEHGTDIRLEICQGLEFLGITLDKAKNRKNQLTISKAKCRPIVLVIQAQEDLAIARHTTALLAP